MTILAGWGGYPKFETRIIEPATSEDVRSWISSHRGIVSRGNGRSYGDASLGEAVTLDMRPLNRLRLFEWETGRLTVESGVMLKDILMTFIPRGFFPPVVPGTKHVTIGGMIAADVHGKNHHVDGGFGKYVERLSIALPSGEIVECSGHENHRLFRATIGGMGLTGAILEATFRLRPIETGWMRQQTIAADNLDEAIDQLKTDATYSVAWIDCMAEGAALGRSLIFAAEHATREELNNLRPKSEPFPLPLRQLFSIPLELPGFVSSLLSMKAFNEFYFRRGASRIQPFLTHWDPYFFPLDRVGSWNRIYGREGFVQHQSVIPEESARSALREILSEVVACRNASFLAVLKRLGVGFGTLSFPLAGYTLALDFPIKTGILPLLDKIDSLVVNAGGRIYLAKDARQSRSTFEAGYPSHIQFRDIRRSIGAQGHITSRLSTRLGI